MLAEAFELIEARSFLAKNISKTLQEVELLPSE
jgi:hypothetical protein